MSEHTPSKYIWPCLSYDDPDAALEFMKKAFGFEETLVVRDENDPTVFHHAEVRFPEGGGVMFGSRSREGSIIDIPSGVGCVYVVTDDPDQLFDRATSVGATLVQGLRDEDYGSRGFTVRDPEGVYWSFGTYRGE